MRDFVGYDGDSSDSDDDGAMMSFSEAMMHKTMVPDFWMIMKIDKDRVEVYYHTRCVSYTYCNMAGNVEFNVEFNTPDIHQQCLV